MKKKMVCIKLREMKPFSLPHAFKNAKGSQIPYPKQVSPRKNLHTKQGKTFTLISIHLSRRRRVARIVLNISEKKSNIKLRKFEQNEHEKCLDQGNLTNLRVVFLFQRFVDLLWSFFFVDV